MANKNVAGLNWGVFDHVSHTPQLRSCNCYMQLVYFVLYEESLEADLSTFAAE